jgi:hypothetical protein
LADFAALWFKILRPWRHGNEIFEACVKVDSSDKKFQSFKNVFSA